jgi:transcriptional regulator
VYLPEPFDEQRVPLLHEMMREFPLGALVWRSPDGLTAEHLPFDIDPDPAPYGTLRAHVARANPVWQALQAGVPAMVIFQGPQGYVTPSWYETKRDSGQVVPTWNYMVVHAHGTPRVIEDAAWLRALVERVSARHEGQRALPWHVDDAPAAWLELQLQLIVGLEMPIERLLGKWKLSQNKTEADRAGVARGLAAESSPHACAMARRIAER